MSDYVDDRAVVSMIENTIMTYLDINSNAADTLEGVLNWWLLELPRQVTRAQVLQAIEELVDENVLEKSILHDGSAIYVARKTIRH